MDTQIKSKDEKVTLDEMVALARRLGMSKTADLLEEYGPELEDEVEDL